jgi:hypothetical protein
MQLLSASNPVFGVVPLNERADASVFCEPSTATLGSHSGSGPFWRCNLVGPGQQHCRRCRQDLKLTAAHARLNANEDEKSVRGDEALGRPASATGRIPALMLLRRVERRLATASDAKRLGASQETHNQHSSSSKAVNARWGLRRP